MKIISGKYKGRQLKGYDIKGTRPTMDRVKESLFAMIQDYIPKSTVLDLFSGSGNLAIEALSEGATFAYLVDNNYEAIKTIKYNLKNLNITNTQVINADYKKALQLLENKKIDIIFLDPPYKTSYLEESLLLIEKYHLLNQNGIVICESSDYEKIIYPASFINVKEKKYGDKWVVILKQIC